MVQNGVHLENDPLVGYLYETMGQTLEMFCNKEKREAVSVDF